MTTAPNAKAISEVFKKEDALTVLPELRDYLDILSDDERKGLEADLIASGGARDPLIVWKEKKAIIDGHNRFAICTAHKLAYKTVELSFPDIEKVKEWMLRNQLNRRNLTPMRVSYFRGLLYNNAKQDPMQARTSQGGESTAAKLATQFGVDEKTIRRDGHVAAGIEAVGRVNALKTVKDKIAAITEKNAKFKKEELEEIGKAKDPVVQEEAVKILTKAKVEEATVKTAQVEQKKKAAPIVQKIKEVEKKAPYPVVFVKPAFDATGYNPASEPKPPMGEDAVCYMSVADEELAKAITLINKWGLHYEGTVVIGSDEPYEGLFSNVKHVFMVVATRGIKAYKGKAVDSVLPKSGSPEDQMIGIIDKYHSAERRLDMRNGKVGKGWESLK